MVATARNGNECHGPLSPFQPQAIDTVAQSLAAMSNALASPTAWPTNAFAISAVQYLIEGLGKAFPHRVMTPSIPFVNSISESLAETLTFPSSPVRTAARRVFETVSDYYDALVPAENLKTVEGQGA